MQNIVKVMTTEKKTKTKSTSRNNLIYKINGEITTGLNKKLTSLKIQLVHSSSISLWQAIKIIMIP